MPKTSTHLGTRHHPFVTPGNYYYNFLYIYFYNFFSLSLSIYICVFGFHVQFALAWVIEHAMPRLIKLTVETLFRTPRFFRLSSQSAPSRLLASSVSPLAPASWAPSGLLSGVSRPDAGMDVLALKNALESEGPGRQEPWSSRPGAKDREKGRMTLRLRWE